MNQNEPTDIHENILKTIVSEYTEIFSLSPEDSAIVYQNVSAMDDGALAHELSLIEDFHATSKQIYQRAFGTVIQMREEEDRLSTQNSLTLNF